LNRRAGKQTTLDTPVATPKGLTTIGELKVGDYVIGSNGKRTKVTQLHPINISEVYEVTTKGGTIECCKDHQWTVSTGYRSIKGKVQRQWKTVSTEELLKDYEDNKHIMLPKNEAIEYQKKKNLISPYIMGLWLGDGASDEFKIYGIDLEIHRDVKEFITSLSLNVRERQYAGVTRTSVATGKGIRNQINNELRSLGLIKNKHIADSYKTSTIKDRIEIIRGMMDSDGTTGLDKGKSKERFSNSNINVINDFREVLASLGVESTFREGKGKRKGEYTVNFKASFNPFRLKRKHNLYTLPSKTKGKLYKRVQEVKKTSKFKPMRCITVDSEDSLYIVGKHYILTHNTVFDVIQSIGNILAVDPKKGKPARGAYFGPTRQQTKDTAWDYYKEFLKPLTTKGLVTFNETDLSIKFKTGARINLYSYENLDNIRGKYLHHAVLDEFQLAPLDTFDKILRPMLADKGVKGSCIITGTPAGKNQFFDFYERGLSEDPDFKDWYSLSRNVYETESIEADEIEDIKATSTEEAFMQEYMCSFDAAIRGAYFGKNMARLKQSDRIRPIHYDPAYPVVAAWDMGFDGTVIWYVQKIGEEIRIFDVDYFEDKDLIYCAGKVMNKPYAYECQMIPHDGKKRQYTDKRKSVRGQLQNMGLKVKLIKYDSFDNGIHATRQLIDRAIFSKKCDKKKRMGRTRISMLDSLSLYRAVVNEDAGVMQKNAKHDRHSHVADALRTLAMGLKDNKNVGTLRELQASHSPRAPQKKLIQSTWDPFRIGE
jgi:hypothetical protein